MLRSSALVGRHPLGVDVRAASADTSPPHETRSMTNSHRFARAGPIVQSWMSQANERSPRPSVHPQRSRSGRRGNAKRRETSARRLLGASREAQGEYGAHREEAKCERERADQRASSMPPNASATQRPPDRSVPSLPAPRIGKDSSRTTQPTSVLKGPCVSPAGRLA